MFIAAIRLQGFRDLPAATLADLGRIVLLQGPGPHSTAVGDALELVFSALDPEVLARLVRRWGLVADNEEPSLEGHLLPNNPAAHDLPDQVSWTDTQAVDELLEPGGSRRLKAAVTISPDPPLYGFLREAAQRDPRLVHALAAGAELTLEVSALFNQRGDAMALHLHPIELGEGTIPVDGKDAPAWIGGLLTRLRGRFLRVGPGFDALGHALHALSSRQDHTAYAAFQAAFPERYGPVRVARGPGGRPLLLAGDRDARRWGTQPHQFATLAAAVHLHGADVVWAEAEGDWLDEAVAGEASPLEQVWRVSAGGQAIDGFANRQEETA